MAIGTDIDAADANPPPAAPYMAPPEGPDEIGRLGPYRILGELGRGGMGVVYRAEDIRLRRQVAIKVIQSRDWSASARERFRREAAATARVHHLNVNPLYDVNEINGVTVVVMQLLQGIPLDAALRQHGPLALAESLRIAREVALGLAAAHAQGIIHRDIKPANIWLEGPERRAIVLDFGLARTPNDDALTTQGAIFGTPAYMSPEQARGGPIDARSDLFSLGVVLYQMVAGQRPFQGSNALAMILSLSHDTPRPLTNVPPALGALVMRLLVKDPTQRPGSAREVADELARIEVSSRQQQFRAPPAPAVEQHPVRPRVRGFPRAALAAVARLFRRAPRAVPVAGAKLPLSAEDRAYLADLKWVNEEYNRGRWDEFAGSYIAVAGKKLIDYGPDLAELRARAARKSGLNADRILVTYIEPPIIS